MAMIDGLGAEHRMPPPVAEPCRGSRCPEHGGSEREDGPVEPGGAICPSSELGIGNGVSQEYYQALQDAGKKLEAPDNGSPQHPERHEAVATDSEGIWVGEIRRRRYSRSEMEGLRYLCTGEQRQRWKEVYQWLAELGIGRGVSAEVKSSEAAGDSQEYYQALPDAGKKLEAPDNGSPQHPEPHEAVATDSETKWVGEIRRRRYSRSEMEGLRYLHTGEQQRRWKEVYQGLGPVIAQEYDWLIALSNQKQKHKQKQKKKEASTIMGRVSAEGTPTLTCLDVQDISHIVCEDALVGQDNDTAFEELCGEHSIIAVEDDSSDDEYDSIRKPAFLVEGEPDFESGPPLDGLEYLRRVRWEAAQIPKVKVAMLDLSKLHDEQTHYVPNIPEIAKCPPNILPSKHWEAAFLADFSELRRAFSQQESLSVQPSFSKCSENYSEQSNCTEKLNKAPTMSLILSMDTVSRAATLRNRIRVLETASILSRDNCVWLFALCVAVDTPLDAETCASLRSLLRKCSSLLARKSEPDEEVAMLNVLVIIAGKYFGQSEN